MMSGYVCTVAGGKGGVGKTTTAGNLGVALQQAGRDVAVVDADLGMANLASALDVQYDGAVHDVLAGDASVSEVLADGPAGLTVVPGDQGLEAFADADPAGLRPVVDTLRSTFDVVVVDTGAGLSHEVAVPLGLADGVLLVSTPDDVAVDDTRKTAMLAERLDGEVLGLLVNRAVRTTDVAAVTDRVGFPCLGVVPDDAGGPDEQPVVCTAPDSPSATAYRDLAEVLDGIFFRGGTVEDADPVLKPQWFVDDDADVPNDAEPEDHADGDESGVFGLFG